MKLLKSYLQLPCYKRQEMGAFELTKINYKDNRNRWRIIIYRTQLIWMAIWQSIKTRIRKSSNKVFIYILNKSIRNLTFFNQFIEITTYMTEHVSRINIIYWLRGLKFRVQTLRFLYLYYCLVPNKYLNINTYRNPIYSIFWFIASLTQNICTRTSW